jgi:hypothetical protein
MVYLVSDKGLDVLFRLELGQRYDLGSELVATFKLFSFVNSDEDKYNSS